YQVNLVTEAKMIINLDIQIEYMDLSFVEKLYVARLDGETQLFIPQRLNQTVDQTVYPVDLKTITLHYETLAGEVMRVVYEEQYKVLSCYGTDAQGEEIKLYSDYLKVKLDIAQEKHCAFRHGTKNCSAFFAAKEPPRASHCGVSSRLLVLQESPCFSIAKYEQKNPIIKENDNWIFDWFCPSMFFI